MTAGVATQENLSTARRWISFIVIYLLGAISAFTLTKSAPVLTTIGADFGMGLATVGWINSAFSVMGVVVAFPSAFFIRKLGIKGTVLLSAASLVVGALLVVFATSAAMMLLGRVVEGLALGLNAVVCPAAIVRLFPLQKRGLPMGIWGTWVSVGGVVAFFLAPALAGAYGWRSLWWLSMVLGVIMIVLVLLLVRVPAEDEAEAEAIAKAAAADNGAVKADMKSIWIVSIVFFVWNIVLCGCVASFYPTYLQDVYTMTPAAAAAVTAAINVFAAVGCPIVGPLAVRWGAHKAFLLWAFIISIIFTAAGAFLMVPHLGLMWSFVIIVGLMASVVPTMVFSMVPIYAKTPRKSDLGLAILAVFQNAGMLVGAAAFGAIAAATSWQGASNMLILPTMAIAIVLIFFLTSTKHLVKRGADEPTDDK